MHYDKAMLKSWAEMETWDQYVERNGGLNRHSSKEGFRFLQKEYFGEVKRRIAYCRKLLTEHDESCVYYTLAELFNRCDLDESAEHLYRRPVRYYCIKAIRKNPAYAPLWLLLAEAYAWVAVLGGESKTTVPSLQVSVEENITVDVKQEGPCAGKRRMWFIERAIKCTKRAIDIEPENQTARNLLTELLNQIPETKSEQA